MKIILNFNLTQGFLDNLCYITTEICGNPIIHLIGKKYFLQLIESHHLKYKLKYIYFNKLTNELIS